MGYRSEVSIMFYVRGMDTDPTAGAALKFWFDENYPVREAEDEWCAEITKSNNSVSVDYTDVKWYEDYDHVQAVEAAIRKFDETFECGKEEGHYAHEFLRIGEDDTDIEVERSDWNDHVLYVNRSIGKDV